MAREDLIAAERPLGSYQTCRACWLKAYRNLTELIGNLSLSPIEQQVVMLAAAYENNCGSCLAVYSIVAARAGVPKPILTALLCGSTLPESKLEALRSFMVEVIRSRGLVSDKGIEDFLAAGYARQNVLEVVLRWR
jgi:AhpD family alkylhydroperoxidase